MKCSCIDIGSNTVKVSVFEKKGKHWETVAHAGEQTRLISYSVETSTGRILSEAGINALIEALCRLIEFSEENQTDHLFVFATASLRGVENIDEIQSIVFEKFGINIDVLSGEEEALCSLKGLLSDERCEMTDEGVMIDMGGGSTELVHFKNGKEPLIVSLNFGCLSLMNTFNPGYPPEESIIELVKEQVLECLRQIPFFNNLNCPVYLIGGTARAAAKLIYGLKPRNKEILNVNDFKMIYERMCHDNIVRVTAQELIPKRYNMITAGCAAYYELLKFIAPDGVFVSESGVREGYLERILV